MAPARGGVVAEWHTPAASVSARILLFHRPDFRSQPKAPFVHCDVWRDRHRRDALVIVCIEAGRQLCARNFAQRSDGSAADSFFVVSGLRATFNIPYELGANW